ncbi:MAG TPA: aminotransferase class V-fold PLP-dependent enzyme [Micromonosporaceae bacterium]|jgi:selenocysteine lyase/cysteine desulfurase|nr:aminotransferase class V-fold PLP-dependent enzyme [Micromonosporaceae bacterium]
MRLTDLLADAELRRTTFPVTGHLAYLAHAAVAPLPAAVAGAVATLATRASTEGQFEYLTGTAEAEVRRLAAGMLSVTPEEIALVPSTSAGLAMVAAGLDWRAGDNVLVEEHDFPANVYPWLALRRLGVEVRFVAAGSEPLHADRIVSYVDGRTRLVTLSSTHYLSGRPVIDLCGLGRWLRQRDVLLCVDAIQTLGAQSLCGRHVDFLAADGHKWLLAPKGMGLLLVRDHVLSRLRPVLTGWRSVPDPRDLRLQAGLASSARRYEPGSVNELGLVGLHAALSLLTEVGLETVGKRIGELRQRLVSGLRQRDARLVGEPDRDDWGGIVSFTLPGEVAEVTEGRLRRAGVVVSRRQQALGGEVVRAAPHFYTSEGDIDRLLDVL